MYIVEICLKDKSCWYDMQCEVAPLLAIIYAHINWLQLLALDFTYRRNPTPNLYTIDVPWAQIVANNEDNFALKM